MEDLGWPLAPKLDERALALEATGHSVIYVGWAGRVHAVLSLDDTPLSEARSTIAELQALGLHVTLLTGDHAHAARRVGAAVGVEDIRASLSPEEKRAALDRLRQRYEVVAMVGDGLNDGPVLADADVGIAVGSATDLARETAALVLPPGGLWMLPWVVSVVRMVRRTILTNLMWAFGYNLVALTLAVLGLLQPVLAAAVMASSSLLLVVNSLRLSRLPDPVPEHAPGAAARASRRVPATVSAFRRWRVLRSSSADERLQPNVSCMNAEYQPTASCAVLRRVSALSPTLLTKVLTTLILPASASGWKLKALVNASSGARNV